MASFIDIHVYCILDLGMCSPYKSFGYMYPSSKYYVLIDTKQHKQASLIIPVSYVSLKSGHVALPGRIYLAVMSR